MGAGAMREAAATVLEEVAVMEPEEAEVATDGGAEVLTNTEEPETEIHLAGTETEATARKEPETDQAITRMTLWKYGTIQKKKERKATTEQGNPMKILRRREKAKGALKPFLSS